MNTAQRTWQRMWGRDYSLFYFASFISIYTTKPGFDGARNKIVVPEGGLYAIYLDKEELDTLIKNYTSMLLKADMEKFALQYEAEFDAFLDWSQRILSPDLSSLTDNTILSILKLFLAKIMPFTELQFDSFLVLDGAARKVEAALSGTPSILQAVTIPYKRTKITEARIELLQMIDQKKISDKALQQYLEKYNWIPVSDFIHSPMSLDELKSQIAGISDPAAELSNIIAEQKKGLEDYKKYFESIDDLHFKKLVEITHYFSYLKEMRDDYRRPAYLLWGRFLKGIGGRIGLTLSQVGCLTPNELIDAFTNRTDYLDTISKRREQYALWYDDAKLNVYAGKDAGKISAMVQGRHRGNIVKGFSASTGRATGQVYVIFHRGEFDKFSEGGILVTTMTHPEFLPLMKKASAIVTDEGGITSHAAIVSRELKKPCVIGTKIATKVLKDGDMVEVDATKGVVKIIERKN